jgi:hypothetical protein
MGTATRDLRAFRYDPPGYAKHGARQTTFQSALEQCEQFLAAARPAGYATRSVQLFYALSQAGRAIVAASPHIGNQEWRVHGHGLTANTDPTKAADVTVTATKAGLFPSVATALNLEPLVPDEPVEVRELWPLLPETAFVPLSTDPLTPVLLFSLDQDSATFSHAKIDWIPARIKDSQGERPESVKQFLNAYPALREIVPMTYGGRLIWSEAGPGLGLAVSWRRVEQLGSTDVPLLESKTIDGLGVASYRSADDFMITPAIGSMSTGLHPMLVLWAVLLGLSSLARYAPASWSQMIDIDRSAEANAIENLLEQAIDTVPAAVIHSLNTFR